MSNILVAFKNIIQNPILDLQTTYKGSNRINNMGDGLETYIKDAFCNAMHELDSAQKNILYSQTFSYLGNQNNPPDMILKSGDSIEVKKIESLRSAIALNSSYPKDKLYANDTRITQQCRNCEDTSWISKDIIYTIGVSPRGSNKLTVLWFIYGDCYAATKDIYLRIANKITDGIKEIAEIELADTEELAKVKKVDPLGITDLRVRGMWSIKNPIQAFADHVSIDTNNLFTMNLIILTSKYDSFPLNDKKQLENNSSITIKDIKIKSPNNPANLLEAKLITYEKH